MNNLISTEKALKHWLKNKVAVTTATVVGFLIMGTVSFGANIEKEDITTSTGNRINTVKKVVSSVKLGDFHVIDGNEEQKIKTQQSFGIKDSGNKHNIVQINGNDKELKRGLYLIDNNNLKLNGHFFSTGDFSEAVNITPSKDSKKGTLETEFKNAGSITSGTEKSNSATGIFVNNQGAQFKSINISNAGNIEVLAQANNSEGKGIYVRNSSENTVIIKNEENGNIKTNTKNDQKTDKSYGIKSQGNVEISNAGLVETSSSNFAYGIYATDMENMKSEIKITNTNEIRSQGNQNNNNISYGILSEGDKNIIENTGLIEAIQSNIAYGIATNNEFKITNSGTISAEGRNLADGIAIFADDKTKTSEIVNTGIIEAFSTGGGSSSAISVTGKLNKDTHIEITNEGTLRSKREEKNTIGRGTIELNTFGEGTIDFTNRGTIEVTNGTAIALNSKNITARIGGTIELNGNSYAIRNNNGANIESVATIKLDREITDSENFDVNSLFTGNTEVKHLGNIEDSKGKHLTNKNSSYLSGTLSSTQINNAGKNTNSVTLGKEDGTKIINSSSESISLAALNIIGKIDIINSDKENNKEVKIEKTDINIGNNGILIVGGLVSNTSTLKQDSTLSLNKTLITHSSKNGIAVNLTNGSTLKLTDVTFNGGISSDDNTSNKLEVYGNTSINRELGVSNIKVGTDTKTVNSNKLTLDSESSFTKNTTLNTKSGTTIFKIGTNGENALKNSKGIVTIDGNIDFDTTNLTTDKKVELNNGTIKHELKDAIYTNKTTGVYTTNLDKEKNTLEFSYNRSLFADARLNEINNAAQIVNDKFSNDISIREGQMDKIYSGSIYAETIRAAYDNLKLNEGTILSLSNNVKAGEFTAEGRAIYNKDEYKRDGIVGKYDVENETSGLLASLEYGVNDTTKTGLVFAGSKQDLDVTGGKADGDLFYLGFYGVKSLGNYDLTAGLGYQLGKYDATNTAANVVGKDKYDTKALSGYVQAKYLGDLGDGLSIQPKVKLGYTHLKQDSAKDSYFGLTDTDVTTFDTELGADLVKTVQLEKSKVDVKFGTAFVKTFGDTDKEFKGQFFGANTASNQFGVHGGELSENVLKFNLGAEVANENGFFYNGGFTYEFGSEDMKSYGVNVGAGYRF